MPFLILQMIYHINIIIISYEIFRCDVIRQMHIQLYNLILILDMIDV